MNVVSDVLSLVVDLGELILLDIWSAVISLAADIASLFGDLISMQGDWNILHGGGPLPTWVQDIDTAANVLNGVLSALSAAFALFDIFQGALRGALQGVEDLIKTASFTTDVMTLITGPMGLISSLQSLVGGDSLQGALANLNKASNSQLDTLCQQTGACQ
jgi:hypothetical protein